MQTAIVHNYDAARKAAAAREPGKIPTLQYRDGKRTALLPHGQQVNLDRFTQGPTTLTGKAARRERIARRRAQRVAAEHEAAEALYFSKNEVPALP